MKLAYILAMLAGGFFLGLGGLIRWGSFLAAPQAKPFRSAWDKRGLIMAIAGASWMILVTIIYESLR